MLHIVRMYKTLFFSLIESKALWTPDNHINDLKEMDTSVTGTLGEGNLSENEVINAIKLWNENEAMARDLLKKVSQSWDKVLLQKFRSDQLPIMEAHMVLHNQVVAQSAADRIDLWKSINQIQWRNWTMYTREMLIKAWNVPWAKDLLGQLNKPRSQQQVNQSIPASNGDSIRWRNWTIYTREMLIKAWNAPWAKDLLGQLNSPQGNQSQSPSFGKSVAGKPSGSFSFADGSKMDGALVAKIKKANLQSGSMVMHNWDRYTVTIRNERVLLIWKWQNERYTNASKEMTSWNIDKTEGNKRKYRSRVESHFRSKGMRMKVSELRNLVPGLKTGFTAAGKTTNYLIYQLDWYVERGSWKKVEWRIPKLNRLLNDWKDGQDKQIIDLATDIHQMVEKYIVMQHIKRLPGVNIDQYFEKSFKVESLAWKPGYSKGINIIRNSNSIAHCLNYEIMESQKYLNHVDSVFSWNINYPKPDAKMVQHVNYIKSLWWGDYKKGIHQYFINTCGKIAGDKAFTKWDGIHKNPRNKKAEYQSFWECTVGETINPRCVLTKIREESDNDNGTPVKQNPGKHWNNESTSTTWSKGKEWEKSNQKSAPSDQRTTETKSSSKSDGGKRK